MIADEKTLCYSQSFQDKGLHYATGNVEVGGWGVAHTRKPQVGSGGRARKGNCGRRFYCGVNGKEWVRQVSQFRTG